MKLTLISEHIEILLVRKDKNNFILNENVSNEPSFFFHYNIEGILTS